MVTQTRFTERNGHFKFYREKITLEEGLEDSDSEGLHEAERRIQQAAQTKATDLELCNLGLIQLPESIGQLTQLQRLDVFQNQLTALPESLDQLLQLQSLNVAHNQLTALPESLGQLTKLQSLNVAHNQLTALPESLGQLTKLQSLYVTQNQLTALPESLGQLTQLQSLGAADNQLTGLPEALGQLTQLQRLDVSCNELTALPESSGQLTQLRSLHVSKNRLTALPEALGQLSQLQRLDASDNELTALPESLRRLVPLGELYLHGNDGLGLPPEVLGPTWMKGGDKNPAAFPAAILEYYFRTRRGRRPLNEAKLILVGRGGVGKTCLVNRLLRDTFKHQEETPGIDIEPWEVTLPSRDHVRLHVWDFGGQRILHGTHQFFLTERTLYLLVLSAREDNATQDAEYWLQLIKSFGGQSRVIIALNKSKQHPFDVNRGLLLEKYPFIADFVKTDCADRTGLPELKQLIFRETETLEHRKTGFPEDWFKIKERLASMAENFVEWEQYQAICRDLGEKDPQAQRKLAGFLHILGIALHYADDPRLKDTRVLKPTWVTDGIYTLLRAGQKKQRGGVLTLSDLAAVLDPKHYPTSKHEFLLGLMEKFQLCFRLPGQPERYLVPELLGENQPDEIRALLDVPGLGFRYQYEVLPEGLLPRFIVQTHIHSEAHPDLRWRTGVVLERDGCRAVVRADARERRVDIHITGPERPRRDLLAIIREKFDDQHRDLKGLTVDERVPVPGERGVSISYHHLLELEEDREEEYRPEGMRKKVRVTDLLNGIESKDSRELRREREKEGHYPTEQTMAKKHLFLSYCHDNDAEVKRLHDELVAAGEAVWWDKDILGGQDWQQEIRRAMKDSYAVVLCLSAELAQRVASGVYPEVLDAIKAYRRQSPGIIYLIPVKLSDCETPDIEIDDTRTLDRVQAINLFPPQKRSEGLNALLKSLRATANHP